MSDIPETDFGIAILIAKGYRGEIKVCVAGNVWGIEVTNRDYAIAIDKEGISVGKEANPNEVQSLINSTDIGGGETAWGISLGRLGCAENENGDCSVCKQERERMEL